MDLRICLQADTRGITVFGGTTYQDTNRIVENENAGPSDLIELAQLADRICGHTSAEPGPMEKRLRNELQKIADQLPVETSQHLTAGARLVALGESITKAIR